MSVIYFGVTDDIYPIARFIENRLEWQKFMRDAARSKANQSKVMVQACSGAGKSFLSMADNLVEDKRQRNTRRLTPAKKRKPVSRLERSKKSLSIYEKAKARGAPYFEYYGQECHPFLTFVPDQFSEITDFKIWDEIEELGVNLKYSVYGPDGYLVPLDSIAAKGDIIATIGVASREFSDPTWREIVFWADEAVQEVSEHKYIEGLALDESTGFYIVQFGS
jgi:hypothetical protein